MSHEHLYDLDSTELGNLPERRNHDHRTLTPEVARLYATSLGDVFTSEGDAGVIDATEWTFGWNLGVKVVGTHVDRWFYADELTYNHTEYLRVKAQREREGY